MDFIFSNSLTLFILLVFGFQNAILTSSFVGECITLLKFKQSLIINKYASSDPFAYNKLAYWDLQGENRDCCSWEGVECDKSTGHVIGLELDSSFLFGSLNSSSNLFNLVHLQSLNLADNSFNFSQIPSEIGLLSGLKSLNLSQSDFFGPIPQEISRLSKLVSLDLSYNVDSSSSSRLLKLENPGLISLLQNLTCLKDLDLSEVDISSKLPDTLTNLSSLETLRLRDCSLYGEFQMGIFRLANLRVLNVRDNENLSGYLPEFDQRANLETLVLASTRFSGKIPESIGNLTSLGILSLGECDFSGSIPASIGNLRQLTHMDLHSNNFSGLVPRFENLSKLSFLSLANNKMNVSTLSWLVKLTKLTDLHLSGIDLSGSINLLSNNTNLPKFKALNLTSCNLKAFPDFLRYQDELEILILAGNKIHGRVPKWMLNVSKENLLVLVLSDNFLTGFEQNQVIFPWDLMFVLDLSNNMMRERLPIPASAVAYFASNNRFFGEISPSICHLSQLKFLELANNNLTGTIPPCLGNSSDILSILDLAGNNLQGPIPQNFKKENMLQRINLSRNQLNGTVPRSLENCKSLFSLDLSRNLLEDEFPFWLASLPVLDLLLLSSNKLYGPIKTPKSELEFPNLRICDLSHNNFTGPLPEKYFQTWKAMKSFHGDEAAYMVQNIRFYFKDRMWGVDRPYSMTIENKGFVRGYDKIVNIFVAIDLSSNNFEGEIPESIGILKGLELLNLANNKLTGIIPSSIGDLKNLESLDISQNDLSGEIPKQLVDLTFLAFLNVSENKLTGPIPKGEQFDTFQSNSYEGNLGLCGDPLSRKCENLAVPMLTPPPLNLDQDDDDSDFPSGFDWVMIGLGFASGSIVGLVIGRFLCNKYYKWFVRTFLREKSKSKRVQRRGGN